MLISFPFFQQSLTFLFKIKLRWHPVKCLFDGLPVSLRKCIVSEIDNFGTKLMSTEVFLHWSAVVHIRFEGLVYSLILDAESWYTDDIFIFFQSYWLLGDNYFPESLIFSTKILL